MLTYPGMPSLYAALAVILCSGFAYWLGRKRGKAAWSESREATELEIFNQLLKASTDGFVLYKVPTDGTAWRIVLCNQRMAEMHCYTT